MNYFTSAKKFFTDGNYKEALELYKKAGDIFGQETVKFNIYQCEKLLDNIDSKSALTTNTKTQSNEIHNKSEAIKKALHLASQGNSSGARNILKLHYENNNKDCEVLLVLAKLDLMDHRFKDALKKAATIIDTSPDNREGYRIGEQACIELGSFDEANRYFLSQPPIINSETPRERGKNPAISDELCIPNAIAPGNDYRHILNKTQLQKATGLKFHKKASVIVPVYNRHKILANTLAALLHQTYPQDLIEILVVDDGSHDEVFEVIQKYERKLNLYYLRQKDFGYRLAAARNLGIKAATGDAFIFMDADILPCPDDIKNYMEVLHVSDECLLIGHRRYVDVSNISDDDIAADINVAMNLPNINPNNDVADRRNADGVSIDWRLPVYETTNYLINDLWPFTKAAGGNIAFSRALLEKAGLVDEEFTAWGCEDGEHGYRLYNAGAYFIPMMNIMSLHQEPLDEMSKEPVAAPGESFRAIGHKITREIFARKCPAPTVRKYEPGRQFDVPKVSIYIPAYNAEKYIVQAIESCLTQDFSDLEVCICNDGSTDGTLALLEKHFGNNPKVRWITQENAGIGRATNTAISMARGMYIAQLDSDDILKQGAIKACVQVLDYSNADAVYTDCEYIDSEGKFIRNGWCGGDFSRSWLATGMIATHFRMFRKRLWSRVENCNEKIKNAVDLDLWLKLYERGDVKHIHKSLYCYRWHGQNTSIQHRKQQETNHLKVVGDSLKRLGLSKYWEIKSTNNALNPREFKILPKQNTDVAKPENLVVLIPCCEKYAFKRQAIRDTWGNDLQKHGIRYLFLMGKPDLKFSKIEQDTLYVPCEDNYESLLLKLVLGYEFIYTTMDFDYIYKIDDDCYPNIDHLVTKIIPQLEGSQYSSGATHPKGAKMNDKWHFGKCSTPEFDKPFKTDICPVTFGKGGYGYFLRKDTLPLLIDKITLLRKELIDHIYSYEDIRVAEFLSISKISVKKLENYSTKKAESPVVSKDIYLHYDITESEFYALRKRLAAPY